LPCRYAPGKDGFKKSIFIIIWCCKAVRGSIKN
jgi:hypothetical protein